MSVVRVSCALLVLLASACFSPQVDLCGVTCGAGDPCPGAMTCEAETCGGPMCAGGGDGGAEDARTADAATTYPDAPLTCTGPALNTLTDNFNDPTLNVALWEQVDDTDCAVEVVDGRLQISSTGGTCGVRSLGTNYCLRGHWFSVQLTDAAEENDPVLLARIAASPIDYLEISAYRDPVTGDQIGLELSTGGVAQTGPTGAFADYDVVRVGSSGGVLTIERYRGLDRLLLWTVPEPAWATAVGVELLGRGDDTTDDGQFENLNITPGSPQS